MADTELAETIGDLLLDSLETRRDGKVTPELTALCKATAAFIVACAELDIATNPKRLAGEFSRNLLTLVDAA